MNDMLSWLFIGLVRAVQRGGPRVRIVAAIGGLFTTAGVIVSILSNYIGGDRQATQLLGGLLLGFGSIIVLALSTWERSKEQERSQARIEKVEEQVREHPERPQLAWDLARTKLENYLDRNLSQLQSIFWLTLLVMLSGFGFVLYCLMEAFAAPANFPVSIVGSVSGVIISFIGGSFLLIYRSILDQTRSYVSVLERINAVGMAVQVLGAIAEDAKDLKNQATAGLAKQLIEIYAKSNHENGRI